MRRVHNWNSVRKLIKRAEEKEKVDYTFVRWEIIELDRKNLEDAERIMQKNYPEAYKACKGALEGRRREFTKEDNIPDGEILFVAFNYDRYGVAYLNKKVAGKISDIALEIDREFIKENGYGGLGGRFDKIVKINHRNDIQFHDGEHWTGYETNGMRNFCVYRKGEGLDNRFREGEFEEVFEYRDW